jgi:hypothetical protein
MRTELALTHLSVDPGRTARIEIEVTNNADVIDGVTAIVDGLDPNWIRFDSPVVSLFPSTTSTIGFDLDIPSDCPAGDYLVIVRVVSTIDADRQTVHDLWVTVTPVVDLSVSVRPRIVTAGSKAKVAATFVNRGNAPAAVFVTAVDPAREADCRVVPSEITVPQGDQAITEIELRGPRPWFGQTANRSISVMALSGDVEVEEIVTFNQKPRIPRGLVTFLILAGIIALWASIFLLVVNALRSGEAPGKATASEFDRRGAANVSLAAIAGTATGQVVASTTGEGVPRITVEAFRRQADGGSVQSGSAATDDDGVFELASLLPGSYIFKFSAEGYEEIWYPDATSEAAAGVVRVEPAGAAPGVDVVLTGRPGSLVGSVAVPESTVATPLLTVTATLDVSVEDLPDGVAPPEQTVFTQDTTGDILLTGLPTPGTYSIRIEGADFDAQVFEESLVGGEVKVINSVRLGAAAGSIAGRVADAAGTPLGGVSVVVSSGDLSVETTTPTSGNVGEFLVVGLETPATYVLSFSLDGYSSQTISLDLLAGEDRAGLSATLVGGLGVVSGTVRDGAGTALGEVEVVVAGGDFTASTTTLTSASESGGVGSYRVSDIPVPGVYTVSFVAPGYVTEVIEVGFLVAGPVPGADVVLRPDVGSVSGTVLGGGTPLGDVLVELSNGVDVRSTVTATSPAGRFVFAGVPVGTYTLRAVAPGFEERVALVRVAEGDQIDEPVDLAALTDVAVN